MSTPISESGRRPSEIAAAVAKVVKVGSIILVTALVAVLLGPFWFLAPIIAFTLAFSPRFAGAKKWTMRDEGFEQAKAVREFRKEIP